MTSAIDIELYIKLNGGAPQTGVVSANYADVVTLTLGAFSVLAKKAKYRIRAYPPGFPCPAGWTTEGAFYVANVANGGDAPNFNLPAAITAQWGKFIFDVTINDGLISGALSSSNVAKIALQIASTSGVVDIAFLEENEFDSIFGWHRALQGLARRYDGTIPGSGDVGGPSSSVSGNLAVFYGPGGKTLRDFNVTIALIGGFNVKDPLYGALGNDTADDTTAITNAVAAAYAADEPLRWPDGVYKTTASIPHFHDVKHIGGGVIHRGSDFFVVAPNWGDSNVLYVATSGSSANDGLSSSQPFTPSEIPAVLKNYGPLLNGSWTVQHAAGTYARTTQVTLDGLKSLNPITLQGPAASYGVPTAIYDGTGSTGGTCGLYFRNGVRAVVRDLKLQNFASTDAMGVTADRHCELVCDNVHDTGNDLAGINAESHTRLYVTGGIHANNNFYNIRAYGQCLVTIGYASSSHRVSIGDALHSGGSGILIRDNSSGHVDYCDIKGVHDGGGVELINQSRVHLVSCVFGSVSGGVDRNYYNVKTSPGCTFIDDGTNTFNTAISKSIVQWGFGIDSASLQLSYYDLATGWYKWGRKDSLTPKALFGIQDTATSVWGGSHNGNVLFSVTGGNNAYIGLGAGNSGEVGIMADKVSNNRQGQFGYVFASDYWFLRVGAADSYRFYSSTFRPETDNALTLGVGAQRWSVVYAGTGTINTSDEREKEQIEAIPDALLDAWEDVEWVRFKWRDAVETKADGARWHYGAIAQRVKAALERHGLDPFEHGLLCYDEWEAEPEYVRECEARTNDEGEVIAPAWREVVPARPAGNRYGLRYDEALVLEAALMRRELGRLRRSA